MARSMKAVITAIGWLVGAVAALFAPALAAFASAILYFSLYGVRAEPAVVVQLYAGYFIVLNLVLVPALASRRRHGTVALIALIVAGAGVGLLLAVRAFVPPWPPAPLARDLVFIGGGALIAAFAWRLAALFS